MTTYQAGADRPDQSRTKMCVSFNRICLSITLQGLDHKGSCHSKFSNQFSKSELHGGLAEETVLTCLSNSTQFNISLDTVSAV